MTDPFSKIKSRFVDALLAVLPSHRPIALHEPSFIGNDSSYVQDCLSSGWVSSTGKYVDQFEEKLAEVTGAVAVVATMNGTSALHIGLIMAGVGRDDEVLIPALSFVATANAVSHCGAIPHFVDVENVSFGMDPEGLRIYLTEIADVRGDRVINRKTGRRIGAMVPVHVFGHPARLTELLKISEEFGIPLIEDAAESLGSWYKNKHTGTFGLCGALSFNGNKTITTGGGGALLFNDVDLARKAKHITTTAKISHPWEFYHDSVAWNYRMPNLNAALGCAQLERLPNILSSKRKLADRYKLAFADDPDISYVDEPLGSHSNFWLVAVLLASESKELRDQLIVAANDLGIFVRPVWVLLCDLPMYRNCPSSTLITSRKLQSSIINLPSSPSLLMNLQK